MRPSSSSFVELQTLDDAKAVAQRRGQQPARVVAPTSVNGGRSSLMERAAGPSPIMMSSWKSSMAGIEDLLDDRAEAVDLVDEQHVVRLQVGQQRRQIAGRSSTGPELWRRFDAQLVGDDVGQRGLAQPRRAEDQTVVQGLAALTGGLDKDSPSAS